MARKKEKSLARKVNRSVLKSTIILAVISMLAGAVLYLIPAVSNCSDQIRSLLEDVSNEVARTDGAIEMIDDVMETYSGMSRQELKEVGTPGYYDRFAEITETDVYRDISQTCITVSGIDALQDVFLAGYDKKEKRIIYICDPDGGEKSAHFTGEWEEELFAPTDALEDYQDEESFEEYSMLMNISYIPKAGIVFTGGVPVLNEDYHTVCYLMGQIKMTSVVRMISSLLLVYLALLAVIVIAIAVIMKLRLRRILVKPLKEITDAAQAYSDDKQNQRDVTDHFDRLRLNTGDEIQRLNQVMANMEKGLNDYEEDLKKVTAEKERISTELSLAARIQADMLPSVFPAFPERDEFDVYASMTPAKEVGGDFYDFFLVDEDHLALVIADVAGKGIPAALFMMASKIIIDIITVPGMKPSEILQKTNDIICSGEREEMFVTVWLGILEISTGRLVAANAGHEKPVLIHAGGDVELVRDRHGFVIGGMEGMVYQDYELQLQPGDRIFVYSDGVPEATSQSRGLFGTERLVEALRQAAGSEPEQILQAVRAAVDEFVGKDEQFDDMTMLCLKYMKQKEETSGGETDR